MQAIPTRKLTNPNNTANWIQVEDNAYVGGIVQPDKMVVTVAEDNEPVAALLDDQQRTLLTMAVQSWLDGNAVETQIATDDGDYVYIEGDYEDDTLDVRVEEAAGDDFDSPELSGIVLSRSEVQSIYSALVGGEGAVQQADDTPSPEPEFFPNATPEAVVESEPAVDPAEAEAERAAEQADKTRRDWNTHAVTNAALLGLGVTFPDHDNHQASNITLDEVEVLTSTKRGNLVVGYDTDEGILRAVPVEDIAGFVQAV